MDMTPATATQESPFDALRLTRQDGSEYWSARDLMPVLGYAKWQKFQDVVERAQQAILNVGTARVEDHVTGAGKEVQHGSGVVQIHKDFHLSRYASYLVAMNGDSRKPEIAAAQHYFAVRTREAEVGPKVQEIDYLAMAPSQLMAMAGALDDKADALRDLAGVLSRLRDAQGRLDAALAGEFHAAPASAPAFGFGCQEETGIQWPVISSRGHTRIEQIHPWLTASNLRKSEDGLWWLTTTREVCIGAMRRDPDGVTGFDQAEAARALRTLGWDKSTDLGEKGVWRKRV